MARAILCIILAIIAADPEGPALPGKPLLDEFLRREVRSIAEASRARLRAAADPASWPARREELRRELREMLGLLPEPPRGDLRARVTGTIERRDLGIAVEKVHFQSVPGLYVTANLYRPLDAGGPLPAVLYLCGHGQVKIDGVSYGNKAFYQHHPAWFARNGYVSLIVDTLQLGEIEGVHHGTYRLNQWWWVARGYTPAGVEAWGSIRALDYLASRPEVDPKRIGVTGRSGGGIGTWWLAALDDRPAALVPVAGITDLENHVLDGCIDGHCDCNFTVNLYRWDYPLVAALAAPRPLLLGNTDKDNIFPLGGVLRVHTALRDLYANLGAPERLGLAILEGPHADTQELQVPAARWMARWLREKPDLIVEGTGVKPFDPKDLKVLPAIPPDQRDTTIQETFVPAAPEPEVPADPAALGALRERLLDALRARTFRNSPPPEGPLEIEGPLAGDRERDEILVRNYSFLSEEPFRLPLRIISKAGSGRPRRVVLRIVDDEGWERSERLPAIEGAALAIFPPRGIGPTRWSSDPKVENGIRRRLLVIGRILEETRVHDLRRALRALRSIEEFREAPITLEGRGEMACAALYAALLEPSIVDALDLTALPRSHGEAFPLLNVLRILDIPQALALLFPRQVTLRGVGEEAFVWTRKAAEIFTRAGRESPLRFAPPPEEPPGPRRF